MTAYDTGLAARPDVAWVHDLLANARHCFGQTVAALDEWDRALALEALHAPSLMGKARLLRDLGRYEEARAELDKATLFGAADPELRAMRGDLLVNYLNRPVAAIEDLRVATDQRPEQPRYLFDYSTALVQANRCDAVTL
jgi:tetratricopeptide (TPR) repeat protein